MPDIDPVCIASGLGSMERSELCVLLALSAASGVVELARGLEVTARGRLGLEAAEAGRRMAAMTSEIEESAAATEVLRHRLWLEIGRALDVESLLPLSSRKVCEAANAIGLRAAQCLEPIVRARHAGRAGPSRPATWRRLLDQTTRLAGRATGRRPEPRLGFADIVASEYDELLADLRRTGRIDSADAVVGEAIRRGHVAMARVAVTGGAWGAGAVAVGSAGFAPYVVAAQLSALVPAVGGPALVSLLTVLTNPLVLLLGIAAMGGWAVKGPIRSARALVAARIAMVLALRGTQRAEEGILELVTSFRAVPRLPQPARSHLARRDLARIQATATAIERQIGRTLPPARAMPDGPWAVPWKPGRDSSMRGEIAATGAMTAASMLYHLAAIDPSVLRAAAFSRNGEFAGPLDLAAQVSRFSSAGSQFHLRGYTAEQLVLSRLIEKGHDVALPASASNPGYDLVVDGCDVQVKCGTSLSLLDEHFARYPDTPVIANVELLNLATAADRPWLSSVSTLDGFDSATVDSLVHESLAAADAVAGSSPPVFAVLVGTARGAYRAWKGEIALADLPAWLVLDLSLRGALATAGHAGGSLIGLVVIGPAGAIVLGSALGLAALAGVGPMHRLVDRRVHAAWHRRLDSATTSLHAALADVLGRRIKGLMRRYALLEAGHGSLPRKLREWLGSRALDDAIAAIETLAELPQGRSSADLPRLLVLAEREAPFDRKVARLCGIARRELRAKPPLVASRRRGPSKAEHA